MLPVFLKGLGRHQKVDVESGFRDTGSVKKLEGRILVLTMYVSDDIWPLEDKKQIAKAIREAEDWLEDLGMKGYGKEVRFVNSERELTEPMASTPRASSLKTSQTVEAYLRRLGIPAEGFRSWGKETFGCDQSLLLIAINREGRSFAAPDAARLLVDFTLSEDKPEGAYILYSALRTVSPSMVAHEMLHLFGAMDLYEELGSALDKEKADRIESMYPKEIMRTTSLPLDEVTVSPLTAWLVGLTEKKEDWFDDFLCE